MVIAQTSYGDRYSYFNKFSQREVNCLVSVSALSEGFDSPIADCVVLCRPTKSRALAIQMVGRGLRYHPQKQDCLVLDFAGILRNFGAVEDLGREAYSMWPTETTLVNDKFVKLDEQNTQTDDNYQILCPECDQSISSTAWKCPHCGHQLKNPEESIELPSLENYIPLVLQDKAAVFQELLREAFRTSRHPESEFLALWRTLSSRKTG